MATILSDLLKPALRKAGVTVKPGITPGADAYAELIPELNRMMASYSLDGHRIYTNTIQQFPLTSGQKIYTIGPGGQLDTPRPLYIKEANIIFPTSPTVRWPVKVFDDDEWASISVQDITGAPPIGLYYDGSMDANGRGNLYLWFQPPADYILELYIWLQLKSDFTAASDAVVLPPGYEAMIVSNLALRAASLYPHEATVSPLLEGEAARDLQQVIILNSECPLQVAEPGFSADRLVGGVRGWLSGDIH